MVKVNGPALSVDASGTLADTMVFSKWKGRNYVRSHVKPSQPRSGPQVGVRAMFKFLSKEWAGLTTILKATWLTTSKATNISEFNAFTSFNQKLWRNFLTPSKSHARALISTAPTAPTLAGTVGVRQVSIAITKGANVADWGYTIHRFLITATAPAFSNCIAVVQKVGAGVDTFVDTPLAPGIYFWKVIGFMADGVVGAISTELTATVV
jgi:hypothetical protein